MTTDDVLRLVAGLLLAAVVSGVVVMAVFLTLFAMVKQRFRSLGLSKYDANHVFEMHGLRRWRTRDPLLTLATSQWARWERRTELNYAPAPVREAFEIRLEGFRDSLGDRWQVAALSIAHDVRAAVAAGRGHEVADYFLDRLEETLPHAEDMAVFVEMLVEFGVENGCDAAYENLPIDYARALFPPAPTFAEPMSKTEYLRDTYGVFQSVSQLGDISHITDGISHMTFTFNGKTV